MKLKQASKRSDILKCLLCEDAPCEKACPYQLPAKTLRSVWFDNEDCASAFEAGWAGAAFKTICNFDIHEASPRFASVTGDNGNIIGFKNIEQLSDTVEEQ